MCISFFSWLPVAYLQAPLRILLFLSHCYYCFYFFLPISARKRRTKKNISLSGSHQPHTARCRCRFVLLVFGQTNCSRLEWINAKNCWLIGMQCRLPTQLSVHVHDSMFLFSAMSFHTGYLSRNVNASPRGRPYRTSSTRSNQYLGCLMYTGRLLLQQQQDMASSQSTIIDNNNTALNCCEKTKDFTTRFFLILITLKKLERKRQERTLQHRQCFSHFCIRNRWQPYVGGGGRGY